ncbi:hypothetical protein, partial [Stenotrophomonas sp. 3diitr2024]|uniref:hypothetical protein n=1 Tax=Stenotrophomonas sp. 3diitr2024 TaxID=3345115 RepID=UPI0035CBEDE7
MHDRRHAAIVLSRLHGSHLSDNWVATYGYWAVLGGVIVTSFYSFRLLFLTFHGAGGTDYRLAMGHAQVDLAFYAGTEPQRCDGNARAV